MAIAGNNLGIRVSRGKIVATLNPDVELEPDAVERIVKAFEGDSRLGIASPKALRLRDKKMIDSTGTILFPNYFITARGAGEYDSGQYDRQTNVFGAIGAYAFYRRSMLERIALPGPGGQNILTRTSSLLLTSTTCSCGRTLRAGPAPTFRRR